MKQYLLSIYQPDGDPPPADVLAEIMRDVARWTRSCAQRARGCSPAACTRRAPRRCFILASEEMPMTDGPYVEGKEHIGGLTIIRAANLDEALEWGRKLARATTLPIEVRPFQGELED